MKTTNLKSLLFLPLLFLMLFSSCQDEETEVTEPSNDETIAPDSSLANLMRDVATNDGSRDNIIDYANCLEIQLPVTVIVDGVEIVIDSETDFEDIEDIFDEYDDDDDDLEIAFPITVIFSDYTTLVVANEDDLEELIEECNDEDEEDDDIECIDFQFPINISIYNTDFQVINTVAINDDEALYDFIENLEGGVLASLNFPVTLVLANGETLVVENNQELEEAIENAEDDCDEDDDYDWDDDDDDEDCDEESIELALKDCEWEIIFYSSFPEFEGFTIEFNEDYSFVVLQEGQVIGDNSTWSVSESNNSYVLTLITDFEDFNGDWMIVECDDDEFELVNGDKELVIEQGCDDDNEDCDVNLAELEELLLECDVEVSTYDASGNIIDENYLNFNANGEVTVNGTPAVTEVGTWSLSETNSGYGLTIDGLATFNLLNGDWLLLDCEDDELILEQGTGNDAVTMELEQDCEDCENPEDLIDDLVIYMPFSEEAHDLISGFNAQNITNTFVEDREGNSSCAMAFTGNDTFEIPVNTDSELVQGDSFSISLWFKMQNTEAGDLETFFRSPGNATQGFQLGVYDLNSPLVFDNADTFSLWDNDWNGEVDVDWENTDWHHLVVTVDENNTVRLYRDGVQRNVTENSDFNIGSQASDRYIIGENFVGHLDDLRVYKKALSPNEVGELFDLDGDCYTCL